MRLIPERRRSFWLVLILAGCSLAALPQNDQRQAAFSLERQGRIAITSNLPFDEWTEIFGSERLTGALLDRVTHHVHILEMNADSYRLRQSRRKRV